MPYTIIGAKGEAVLYDDVNTEFENSNPCNLMTLNNIGMLCDDIVIDSYTADNILITFSETNLMSPDYDLKIPVVITKDASTTPTDSIEILEIHNDGTISLPISLTDAIVHTNGILFHFNSKYYTPAIGNIYDNGTSPLSAQ